MLHLKQLKHLDLSNNDFGGIKIPGFIGSLKNLRYLNLSRSRFGGTIPPQLSELRILSLGNFYSAFMEEELTSMRNMHWLSSLHRLHHLDMSGVDLSKVTDWLQPSGNNFMDSSLVLKGLSSVGRNLISLDISFCGISTSVLDALHNLTSLLSLDLSRNELTKTISKSFANLCNLRRINLEENYFSNISLTSVVESFFECKLPRLESLYLGSSRLSGQLPYEIGGLTYLVDLQLGNNGLVGMIPDSVGRLSSLETLGLSDNQLKGSLPDGVGQLSKLVVLDISNNLLTGVLTKSHFVKLVRLKILMGSGNNLTLRSRLANWIPSFRLLMLALNSWDLGPQFPSWLQVHMDLIYLDISNARISSTMPDSFWRSFPNLSYLDMSQNHIHGILPGILAPLEVLDVSSNEFGGPLPQLSNSSLPLILDLSNNSFSGSLRHLLCAKSEKGLAVLNLANNHLSGVIPDFWQKWPRLSFLNMENNNLSGTIPTTLGSLSSLGSLNICFTNFVFLTGKETNSKDEFNFSPYEDMDALGSASLVIKGREDTYSTILGLVMALDLSCNNFSGQILINS
ncbi:hypothetical protein L2E82_31884 [Cichorium intybus]|uniref:Uncharacterized protein n=1 Tax=Cichorium intybus TaxID=13427 RepID=A0ACB9BGH1_CICIN|nr:hypothetical protein L2E82_31884 [Cichorium intybus]